MKLTWLALSLSLACSYGVLAQTSSPGPDVTLPRVTKDVRPVYDSRAMSERIQGEVVLRCIVTAEGRPTNIEVEKSLDERLDANAIKALEQWEFEPGRRKQDDQAIAVQIAVSMTFRLK